MLKDVRSLVRAGAALLLLKKRSKAPIERDWSSLEPLTFEQLKKRYRDGMNIGVRLGKPSRIDDRYLHAIDLDVRDPDAADEAKERLVELFGEEILNTACTRSGSGGASRHFYILTKELYSSRKVANSGEKFKDEDGVSHYTWEIDFMGTGRQCVLPPSIHPRTGKPYTWERALDLDIDPPFFDDEVVRAALQYQYDEEDFDLDNEDPMGLEFDEAEDILADLPFEWVDDRDLWIKVGMALHHEFEGSADAFDVWVEFSKESKKFDFSVCRQQWRSFKNSKSRIVTMRTVAKAAHEAVRYDALMSGFDDDEGEDLIADDAPAADDESAPAAEEDEDLIDDEVAPAADEHDDENLSIAEQRINSVLGNLNSPAFPLHIFGPTWERLLRTTAAEAGAPVDFVVGGLLATASALVGNAIWAKVDEAWREPTALWCQIIGDPSVKKTPSLAPFLNAVSDIESSFEPVFVEQHRAWQSKKEIAEIVLAEWKATNRQLVKEGKDPLEKPENAHIPPEPMPKHLKLDSTTVEALIRRSAVNPRGLLMYYDELADLYHNMSKYSSGNDQPIWIAAYGGSKYKMDRVKDNGKMVIVDHFTVSVLGTIQPEPLRQVIQKSSSDGFFARWIPFWPKKLPPQRRPRSRKGSRELHGYLERLAFIPFETDEDGTPQIQYLEMDDDAYDLFDEWRFNGTGKNKFKEPELESMHGKSHGHTTRLAALLELLWWAVDDDEPDLPTTISKKAVACAIEAEEAYIMPMQTKVYEHSYPSEANELAEVIARAFLTKRVSGNVNARELRRESGIKGISGRTPTEIIDDAFAILVKKKFLVPVESKSRGRPKKEFKLSAKILKLISGE